jgi:hypothetical protein
VSDTSSTEPTSHAEDLSSESESDSDAVETADAYEPTSHAKASSASGGSKLSLWLAIAALVLSVVAVTGGVLAYFFLLPHKNEAKYSDQDTKEAKTKMCETFFFVERTVLRDSNAKAPPETGPVGVSVVQIAAWQSFLGGAAYLRDQVNETPATPTDLAKSINEAATSLQNLAMVDLAGAKPLGQKPLIAAVNDKFKATRDALDKSGALEHRGDRLICKTDKKPS